MSIQELISVLQTFQRKIHFGTMFHFTKSLSKLIDWLLKMKPGDVVIIARNFNSTVPEVSHRINVER